MPVRATDVSLYYLCQLVSLSLASNELSTLIDLAPSAMIRYIPKLQNLSLQNNQLSQVGRSSLVLYSILLIITT